MCEIVLEGEKNFSLVQLKSRQNLKLTQNVMNDDGVMNLELGAFVAKEKRAFGGVLSSQHV